MLYCFSLSSSLIAANRSGWSSIHHKQCTWIALRFWIQEGRFLFWLRSMSLYMAFVKMRFFLVFRKFSNFWWFSGSLIWTKDGRFLFWVRSTSPNLAFIKSLNFFKNWFFWFLKKYFGSGSFLAQDIQQGHSKHDSKGSKFFHIFVCKFPHSVRNFA